MIGGFHQLSIPGCVGHAQEDEYKHENERGPTERPHRCFSVTTNGVMVYRRGSPIVKAHAALTNRAHVAIWLRSIWVLAALFIAPLWKTAAFPERFDAVYTLYMHEFEVGTTNISLSPLDNGRFEYTVHSQATGVAAILGKDEVRERSVSLRLGKEIRSLHYSYRRQGRKERHIEVNFDWDTGRATNSVNGNVWKMDIPLRTFDKQNHILALMDELASGVRSTAYKVADGGKLKTYAFRDIGRQRLYTALGAFDTVVVERKRDGATRTARLWFAPALEYLPVQILYRDESRDVTARIRAVTGFPLAETSDQVEAPVTRRPHTEREPECCSRR